ncbi:DUF6567 family protein [Sulfurimonas sp.]
MTTLSHRDFFNFKNRYEEKLAVCDVFNLQVALSILVFASMALFTGCSATNGYMGHEVQTQVQLNKANFNVIKSVEGEASANYFLGMSPSDGNLIAQAKKDMLKKANLNGAQALVNITTDVKSTGFLIWRQKKVYISANVIEFK